MGGQAEAGTSPHEAVSRKSANFHTQSTQGAP